MYVVFRTSWCPLNDRSVVYKGLCEMGFEFFGKNNVKILDLKNKII